jgi:hypothetical protein
MPVGTTFSQNERARERIRTARLLTIADEIAEGKIKGDPKRVALRLQAASMLLRKTLPDLSATDLTTGGQPIIEQHVYFKKMPDGKA